MHPSHNYPSFFLLIKFSDILYRRQIRHFARVVVVDKITYFIPTGSEFKFRQCQITMGSIPSLFLHVRNHLCTDL
uniref:Uncharacterized protein n=1 Tax=Octopus bimaculoides TaxID=37653 RepID=A0A0L8GV99_OCTBM